MAEDCVSNHKNDDMYTALSRPFCDGFEIKVTGLSQACVGKTKARHHILRNDLNAGIGDLVIKNLLITQRKGSTYIWATLTPETAVLDPRFLKHLKLALPIVSEYARLFWGAGIGTPGYDVKVNKIDVAVDLSGSFIPQN